MERLITQKWIAMFPNGQEGWSEIRRTGYPKVFPLAQSTDYSIQVANRIPFDIDEATNNKANYIKAVQMLRAMTTMQPRCGGSVNTLSIIQ